MRSLVDQSRMVNNTDTTTLSSDQQATYWGIVGSVMYLSTRTRPELAVAASILATNFQEPNDANFVSAKCALRYLRSTAYYDMKICPGEETQLPAYVEVT